MKTLGLIGGATWVSTVGYYRLINHLINQRLGGLHSAELLLYSLDFEGFKRLADAGDWQGVGTQLATIAALLERAGAAGIVICANTPHIAADMVQRSIGIPLIDIIEATAREIKRQGLKTVALLGTKFTMENRFFKDRLARHGIATITPDLADREFIHMSIFAELGKDIFTEVTRRRYLDIIACMAADGAEGVVLGCTEIPLLVRPSDCNIPTFDTLEIHARAAVDFALGTDTDSE